MKKTLFITIFTILFTKTFCQSVDTLSIETRDTLITEFLTVEPQNPQLFQYRVSLNEVNTRFAALSFTETMRDFFQSDVVFNESLGQFIVVAKKDVSRIDFIKSFSTPVTYFKKINLNVVTQ